MNMNQDIQFSATIEIELFYSDSQGEPDIHYEYAHTLPQLLEICSKAYCENIQKRYKAKQVQIGKVELVSLSPDIDFPCRDSRYVIELGKADITMKNSVEKA
jgi:hypothetical protein